MDQLIGQVIDDRYEILSVLSHGEQGAVLKVRDRTLEQDMIIKLLHPALSEKTDLQKRFYEEARAAARLSHPAILQVFDYGVFRSFPYVVLRFIKGSTLRQRLENLRANNKWISLERAIWMVSQLAGTLEYAHHQGIVHGDLRPANILLEPVPDQKPPYRPVLTFVRLESDQGFDEGVYLSPEQVQGLSADGRSDIYALGILLYELAVGDLPLPGNASDGAVPSPSETALPLPGTVRPDIPLFLEQVILKAIQKKPEERYGTAGELARALENPEPSPAATRTSLLELPSNGPQYVQIEEKGKPERPVNLKRGEMTIGRGQENDIILSDPEASRRHTRITWDGSSCFVTDLESRNGTYLGQIRLVPDVPKIWSPGQELSIGHTILRLVSPVQPRSEMRSFEAKRAELSVSPQQLTVEAGESVTASLSLGNPGPDADAFTLSLTGIPGDWVSGLPPRIEIKPESKKEITISLHVPRRPESRAGRHLITIKANSQHEPRQSAEVKLPLTVAAYSLVQAEVQPQPLSENQAGQLSLVNLGNLEETFTVQFADFTEELVFQPPQIQVSVPPGETAVTEVRAQLRKPRWFGPLKAHPFSVQISPAGGKPETLNAGFVSRGLIPVWALPIALVLCLFFTGSAGALLYYSRNQATPAIPATPTSVPGAPVLEELCIFPTDRRPATYLNCPDTVQVLPGQTVIIHWKVSNADKVNIEPLGDREPAGEDSYPASASRSFILRAEHPMQPLERSIILVVTLQTLTSGPPTNQMPAPQTTTVQATPTMRPSTAQPTSSPQTPATQAPPTKQTPSAQTLTPQAEASPIARTKTAEASASPSPQVTTGATPSPSTPTMSVTASPATAQVASGTPGVTTSPSSNSLNGGTARPPHVPANPSGP